MASVYLFYFWDGLMVNKYPSGEQRKFLTKQRRLQNGVDTLDLQQHRTAVSSGHLNALNISRRPPLTSAPLRPNSMVSAEWATQGRGRRSSLGLEMSPESTRRLNNMRPRSQTLSEPRANRL